jgi:predicted nucleic acid-binding protein
LAGSSWYTAILDANVLYPQLLRDTLLSLAVERLYHARWSATIHDEWTRNLVKERPDMASKLPAVVALMNASVPDCLVTHYEKLADSIELPDPDDRHVVAAAIAGHADAIVTFNTKDFPQAVLQPYGIEVQHPDEFVMNQLQLHKIPALSAIKKMRARWTNPARSAQDLITAFELRGLPLTADLLREAITLI